MDKPELDYVPSMPVLIRRQSDRIGQRVYLQMPGVTLTFAEADATSQRVAKELLARGVGKGTRVGIHFTYGPDWVVAFFAVTRIGALVMPLSTAYRPAELRKTAIHGDIDTLIAPRTLVVEDHRPFLTEAFGELDTSPPYRVAAYPFLRSVLLAGPAQSDDPSWAGSIDLSVDGSSALADSVPDELLVAAEAQVTPADLLCVVHTSGTTGVPKGVIHTHGAFVRHCENLSLFNGWHEDYTQFSGYPWFWIGGLVMSIGQGLVRGFTLLCLERVEPAHVLEMALEHKPHLIGMWPGLQERFRQYVAASGVDVSTVPALAGHSSGVTDAGRFHSAFGQTETLAPHTAGGPEFADLLDEQHRGSMGMPVPYVEHRIVDPDTAVDLEPGVQGEILVRGYSLSDGLYKLERDEAFDDDGWLYTGDLGYFRDGYLFFTGRRTEMIKTSGSNVAPPEVEAVLAERPDVGAAVVIGLDDPDRGQIVAGALAGTPNGGLPDVEAALAHAAANLSRYKVPRILIAYEHQDLPLLGSGKPDKLSIRADLETLNG